jgi:hypothetical protein
MRSLDRYEIIGSVIAVIGAGIYFMPPPTLILKYLLNRQITLIYDNLVESITLV